TGPAYLEGANSRIGIVAVTTTFDDSWVAGEQRPDLTGRPGVSAIGHRRRHRVSAAELDGLRAVIASTDINSDFDYAVSTGYKQPWDDAEGLYFGGSVFTTETGPSTWAKIADRERIEKAVRRARAESDYVIVSVHAHEMNGTDDER